MFEALRGDGKREYEQGSDVRLREELPKYLSSNIDVYCLMVGHDKYYFLPDCVLMFVNDFYMLSWEKVLLRTNNIDGELRVKKYHSVIVHGRIRKDGGIDQRYNTQYRTEAYWEWMSLSNYGVMSFTFGKDKSIILTTERNLVGRIESVVNDWIEVR